MVYPDSRILVLFSLKEELNSDTSTMKMNLEGIMLSKVSHSQKNKYCDSTYMRHPQ